MTSTILSLVASVAVPVLKLIFEAIAKKKLTDKEFSEILEAHLEQRSNAGQSALDFKKNLADLKAQIAKKKEQ